MNGILLLVLLLAALGAAGNFADAMSLRHKEANRERVREMFYHGYDNYMKHAFPHDELKPLSRSYTDSLAELGNAGKADKNRYQGVAMTLIDSLSTLAVMGNKTEFSRAVRWVSDNVSFDLDVRVNVFEANIRLLGGLLSAHVLASDKSLGLMPEYGQGSNSPNLLSLALDLGERLLVAFDETSHLPYAWVNLRHGVKSGETHETCTAGVGTLLMEFGLLSYLTGKRAFFEAAHRALLRLWSMKSSIGLLGNTFNRTTGQWKNTNAGIGAGIDSYYEYLLKSYMFFGNTLYYDMFVDVYRSVKKYLTVGAWYVEANMNSGQKTHQQYNSLQAFWPGVQTMVGDFDQAIKTQEAFFSLWQRFGLSPERFIIRTNSIHSTEHYYPLRPEFIESTYHLYQATQNPSWLQMGEHVLDSLNNYTRVPSGFASVRNVKTKQLEDRMQSFFLAETCKYLYLLFDDHNFAHKSKYMFTTEGHIFPILYGMHELFGDGSGYGYDNFRYLRTQGEQVESQANNSSQEHVDVDDSNSNSNPKVHANVLMLSKSRQRLDRLSRLATDYKLAVKSVDDPIMPRPTSKQKWGYNTCRNTYTRKSNNRGAFIPDSMKVAKIENEYLNLEKNEPGIDITKFMNPFVFQTEFQAYVSGKSANEGELTLLKSIPYELGPQSKYSRKLSSASQSSDQCVAPPHTDTAPADTKDSELTHGDFSVKVGEGTFHIEHKNSEFLDIRNLGTTLVEFVDSMNNDLQAIILNGELQVLISSFISYTNPACGKQTFPAIRASFGGSISSTLFAQTRNDEQVASFETAVSGRVVFSSPSLACRPFSAQEANQVKDRIVLVHRGQCTFVEKAFHLQEAGAKAIIVANTENTIFMMGNDGSGRKITLPLIMISSDHARKLESCVQAINHSVQQETTQTELNREARLDLKLVERVRPLIPIDSLATNPSVSFEEALLNSAGSWEDTTTEFGQTVPSLQVHGSPFKFVVFAPGKFRVQIEENNNLFVLKLY